MRHARFGQQDVDDAVQRVRTVQGIARAAQDLDGPRKLPVGLEQTVDVAEPGGTERNAVLEKQEGAARPGAGQDR